MLWQVEFPDSCLEVYSLLCFVDQTVHLFFLLLSAVLRITNENIIAYVFTARVKTRCLGFLHNKITDQQLSDKLWLYFIIP